jgi:DNA replication protein DnaC
MAVEASRRESDRINADTRAKALLKRSGVPLDYSGAQLAPAPRGSLRHDWGTLTPQEMDAASKMMRGWKLDKYDAIVRKLLSLRVQPSTLVLCGAKTYRCGKTYLGCAAVNTFCEHGASAIYRRAIDFFSNVKSTFGGAAKRTQDEVVAEYASAELLVLDEFHVRSDTDFENTLLRGLIDSRHANRRSTVLIGNLAQASLHEFIETALVKRINERGGAEEADWAPWWKYKVGGSSC